MYTDKNMYEKVCTHYFKLRTIGVHSLNRMLLDFYVLVILCLIILSCCEDADVEVEWFALRTY